MLLLHSMFECSPNFSADDVQCLRSLYDAVCERECDVCCVDECDEVHRLSELLDIEKSRVALSSRTAKLWIQHLGYVDTVKTLIHAERIGDWDLHLSTVSRMLPLFAATGHNNYARCCTLYLQMMQDLPNTHEWLHSKLSGGFHAVRRCDQLWTGLSTDLLTEQVLMRAIKVSGGLTHGRGMTDSMRCLWVSSLHQCATVHSAISSLVGIDLTVGSDYHVDQGKSRKSRDFEHLNKVLESFVFNSPFDVNDGRLRNIASGIVVSDEDKINCDTAEQVLRTWKDHSYV